ncbi:MAG: lamin tail domain-containing protein [Chitinispirillaceae bacterium]|jgi:hypothetical protein|nr:lamin tail domain-containing protein [Chitinispirillaceae bacterium]
MNRSSFIIRGLFIVGVVTVVSLLLMCGKSPHPNAPTDTGALEIRTCIMNSGLAKSLEKLATTSDSLVIEVSGSDITTIRRCIPLLPGQLLRSDTVGAIPSGTDRRIKVFTIDRTGTTIQADSTGSRTVRIDPNTVTLVNVLLVPALGSICIQLENAPTKVDSVIAQFVADDKRTWGTRAKRSSKMFMSIDKVPHATHGMLTLFAIDTLRDTLYVASKELTFSARSLATISLIFSATPGKLALDLTIVAPGITLADVAMTKTDAAETESGEVLISEIMYAANDSEYVELYNPGTAVCVFDSLYLDIDGTARLLTNVSIGAKQLFVVGRMKLPWISAPLSPATALDLTSTGNWLTLRGKDGRMIDRVAFCGSSNPLEWPLVSGKTAIELDPAINDVLLNNFGRNWRASATAITGTSQKGTPGTR